MDRERMKVFMRKISEQRENELCQRGHFVHGAGVSTCTGCGRDLEEILEDEA